MLVPATSYRLHMLERMQSLRSVDPVHDVGCTRAETIFAIVKSGKPSSPVEYFKVSGKRIKYYLSVGLCLELVTLENSTLPVAAYKV